MIEGCIDCHENGLVRPQIVVGATAEYFDDQDLVAQWLNEKCTVDPENTAVLGIVDKVMLFAFNYFLISMIIMRIHTLNTSGDNTTDIGCETVYWFL